MVRAETEVVSRQTMPETAFDKNSHGLQEGVI
jgi:hypothetical protein